MDFEHINSVAVISSSALSFLLNALKYMEASSYIDVCFIQLYYYTTNRFIIANLTQYSSIYIINKVIPDITTAISYKK